MKKRKLQCINEFKKIGIDKPNRFNAIKDTIGLIGCVKSHIKCIEIAKKKRWPFVCIFEDDLIFIDPNKTIRQINKYINYDYDFLFIGAWIIGRYDIINNDLIRVYHANCLHAYIV